jgi:hypothetical protein
MAGLTALVVVFASAALAGAGAARNARPSNAPAKRDVLVVSNNWAGTADIVDPHTFRRIARIDVIPDKRERIEEIHRDPVATFYFNGIRSLVGEGHNQYVDDGFVSGDGRFIYFSRPSFADVVAIKIATGNIAWRVHVDGYRADHMALSPDGRHLLVSASTANVVDEIDTRTGRIVVRRFSPREQLLARRQDDLSRLDRVRLHRRRRPLPGLDQGQALLRDRRRKDAECEEANQHGP